MSNRISLALSFTALVVAVGGGATPIGEAAWNQVVPRGSVGTLQLKRNAVTSSKIAPNSIRTSQIVNSSLLVDDFKPGQIPQGPKGDKGDKGDRGPVGISGYEIVRSTANVPAGTTLISAQAKCPAGKRVLGGTQTMQAAAVNGIFYGTFIQSSGTNTNDLYSVIVHNSTNTARTVSVSATCARVAG